MGENPIKCLKLLKDHKTCAITVGTHGIQEVKTYPISVPTVVVEVQDWI